MNTSGGPTTFMRVLRTTHAAHAFRVSGSKKHARARRGVVGMRATVVLASLLAMVWSHETRAQALPAQLVQQFQALAALKASRTPVQQKIDSNLLLEGDRRQGLANLDALATVNSGVNVDAGGTVLVDIDTQVTPGLLTAIAAVGGVVVNSYAQYNAVRVRMPIGQIEAIAARSEVRFIGPAAEAYTNQRATNSEDPGPITNAGAPSQGDVAHRADLARSMHGVDGTGVIVGVLSDSVDALAALQASGDLPGTCPQVSGPCVTVLAGQSGNPGSSEGTAIMEIVHDLAPGADIFFATAFAGQASFAANILALQAAGADVIVDDVGYFASPVFQDGIIAQAVDTVAGLGVPYFSSAGNSGNKNDGTSGVFEGTYVPGTTLIVDYSSCHDFGGGAVTNQLTQGSSIYTLQWAEPQGGSSTDYDLYLVDAALENLLAGSTTTQDGTQDPFEWIGGLSGADTGSHLLVCLKTASPSATNRFLHLNTNRGRLAVSTAGQTWGQSAAVGAFSVAAVDAVPPAGPRMPFDGTEPVEAFSSDGPRRIFFQANGTPLGSPVDRVKPDLAAADGVTTATPGFSTFFGTSAAAPHAAAIAALMQDAAGGPSSITPAQIRAAFGSTSLDIEAVGVDRDSGVGIVDALAAVGLVAFTDPVLSGGVTFVKKVHIDELRTRVNALRVGEGLGNFAFTDATLVASSTQAQAVHILELRQALQDVFVAKLEVAPAYTDPVSLVGVPVKAAHIQELRDAVVGLE